MYKTCPKCNLKKLPEEFYNDKTKKNNLSSYCKKCMSENNERYRITGRIRHLKYGISFSEQQKMFKDQNELCAICETKLILEEAHLDHVKNSNPPQVRGFLCASCNKGIGHLKDDINILKRAIKYLEESLISTGNKTNIPKSFFTRIPKYKNYKGVRRTPQGKWSARITVNSKEIFLGNFIFREEAALAYNDYVIKNLPLNSYLNDIPKNWISKPLRLEF